MKRLLIVLLVLVFSSASLSADILGKAQTVSSLKTCNTNREGKLAKVTDADSIYAIGDGGGQVSADLVCKSGVWVITGHSMAVQTATCADNAAGTNAALTLTPSGIGELIEVTSTDAHGCDITLSETGMTSGWHIIIKVVAVTAGAVNIADTSGVSESGGAFAMGLYDSYTATYSTSRWIEDSRSNN